MRPQIRVERVAPQLPEVRCQTQALQFTLSLVFGIGHGAPPEKEAGHRTPCRAVSVAHTTEQQLYSPHRRFPENGV